MTNIVRIRRGFYQITGVTCECGGELLVESHKADGTPLSSNRDFRWESFCARCGVCDTNGWATLNEAVAAAPEFFNPARPQ